MVVSCYKDKNNKMLSVKTCTQVQECNDWHQSIPAFLIEKYAAEFSVDADRVFHKTYNAQNRWHWEPQIEFQH